MFVGGFLSAVGFIHVYLTEALDEGEVKMAWIGSLCTGLLSLLGEITFSSFN